MKKQLFCATVLFFFLLSCDNEPDYSYSPNYIKTYLYNISGVKIHRDSKVNNKIDLEFVGEEAGYYDPDRGKYQMFSQLFCDDYYNKPFVLMFGEPVVADTITHIEVICEQSYDAAHPAGDVINDVVEITVASVKEYIISGYQRSPYLTYKETLDAFNSRKDKVLITSNMSMIFTSMPSIKGEYNISITGYNDFKELFKKQFQYLYEQNINFKLVRVMKRHFLLILVMLFAIFFGACDKQFVEEEPFSLSKSEVAKNEALDIVLNKTKHFLNLRDLESGQTRSNNDIQMLSQYRKDYKLELENVEAVTRTVGTETPQKDTVSVYFVEYKKDDEKGFSIVSDDYRVPYVFAQSDNGSLSDTIFNKGLAIYLSAIRDICQLKIEKYYTERANAESVTRGIYSKYKPSIIKPATKFYHIGDDWIDVTVSEVTDGYVTKDVNPLLKTEWSQHAPYNNKCDNGNSPAGCVPIATAQIMAYFKKPYTTQYWDELTANSKVSVFDTSLSDRVSTLLKTVGSGVDVSYSPDGSGANFKDAVSYLRSVGINCTLIDNIDTNTVQSSLNNSKPVMLAGHRNNPFPFVYTDGHAWIVDGHFSFNYYAVTRYYELYMPDLYPNHVSDSDWQNCLNTDPLWTDAAWRNTTYYHVNWGWGGTSNGYYTDVDYAYDPAYYYRYNQKMIVFQCNVQLYQLFVSVYNQYS